MFLRTSNGGSGGKLKIYYETSLQRTAVAGTNEYTFDGFNEIGLAYATNKASLGAITINDNGSPVIYSSYGDAWKIGNINGNKISMTVASNYAGQALYFVIVGV